ncbi:MAG: hypothetical protein Q4G30_00935 [Actinomycetaceae bacterium]|nr:hypothetical protein [Actinomycetaceae bacterium]
MNTMVGVREFRQGLADYIDQTEPITVTRHGRTVGLFIPVHQDRKAEIAAYVQAAKKANELLTHMGITEDAAVAEFESLRKAASTRQRNL